MAAARPVVASAVGGVPELVRPEETGLLVPAGDPVALSQALERMLKDEAGRKRLATNAFEQVARRFSFDSTLHRYEALYDDVLCNRNRSKSEVRL
jgi:glycosyltransferase involved in cell wall biosynthesis